MNKELILKYKEEFDHWLNGGKILAKTSCESGQWTRVDDTAQWNASLSHFTGLIIDNEYVEFRKALVDGKALEYNTSHDKSYPKWIHLIPENMLDYHPNKLRIKPDESKFKVGDWTRSGKNIHKIEWVDESNEIDHLQDYGYYGKASCKISLQDCAILWKPQPNEKCWHSYYGLVQVIQKNKGGDYTCKPLHQHVRDVNLLNLEPFIGTLPTHQQN